MEIRSVILVLDSDELRVIASALRLYDRTCQLSDNDRERVKTLVHLAERGEPDQGKCYAEIIQNRHSAIQLIDSPPG